MSRFALVASFVVLFIAALLGVSSPASACTCKAPDAASIDAAPAAAEIGVLRRIDGVWVAEVLDDVKGNLPQRVSVLAPIENDGNCGVVWREGTRVGLVFGYDEQSARLTATSCDQIDTALLREWASPPGETAPELVLREPPELGGWSGWLFVVAAVVGVLYLAKNARDPKWRNAWFRPNNARNSPVRRPDDPTERGRFER